MGQTHTEQDGRHEDALVGKDGRVHFLTENKKSWHGNTAVCSSAHDTGDTRLKTKKHNLGRREVSLLLSVTAVRAVPPRVA